MEKDQDGVPKETTNQRDESIFTVTKQTPFLIHLLFPIRGVTSPFIITVTKPLFLFLGLMNQRDIIVPYHMRFHCLGQNPTFLYHNRTNREEKRQLP